MTPTFQQLVDDKARFIGGTLTEHDAHFGVRATRINDIALLPNGDSWVIHITGKSFPVACDIRHCSLETREDGGFGISTNFGTSWTLTPRKEAA